MKIKYLAILAMLLLGSCNKFLEVTPKGVVIATKLADYEGLLYSNAIIGSFAPEMLYMTDDYYYFVATGTETPQVNSYLWREYINNENQTSPVIWGPMYSAIYHANAILNGVMQATDGTEAQKKQLYNEALLVRAYYYLDLLTVFAKAYDPATAATDPGLPMVTSNDVGEKTPPRSSVKAVIDALTADLTAAAAGLPASNANKYRATRYAAFALLSRIALYKGDFTAARNYAEQALAAPHATLNYNNYTAATLPKTTASTEVLFMRAATTPSPQIALYSQELIGIYDSQYPTRPYTASPDLRLRYFSTQPAAGLQRAATGESNWSNFGIRFPEMDLTVAEAMARANDVSGAVNIVNALRKNRIAASDYADQTAANSGEALTRVLDERRRELALGGMRWFDMKRLDKEGRMPEVTRVNRAQGNIPAAQVASLPPHSPRYTFQIPARVLQFNPDMQKN